VALAAFLNQRMPDANLNVVVSAFEDATLPDGAFDLAVAATSFHWVDQRVGLAKLRRVLRPGGHVAIWWMLFDDPTTVDSFDVALESVLGPPVQIVEPGRPPFQLDTEARCADLRRAGFVEVRSDILHTEYRFDADSIRALYATMAIVLQRPPRERAHVLDAVQALVERDFDGAIARSFVTALYTARAPAVSKM
jgi:SAM-dependent methyltransferase